MNFRFVTVIVIAFYILSNPVYAYMDPGTWSYLISFILAFISWKYLEKIFRKSDFGMTNAWLLTQAITGHISQPQKLNFILQESSENKKYSKLYLK